MSNKKLENDILYLVKHSHGITIGELVEDSFHNVKDDDIRNVVYSLLRRNEIKFMGENDPRLMMV